MFGAGVRCIKLINSYQESYPGDGPNLMALYEYAAKNGMLVFNHGWSKGEIRYISGEFPDTDFIFGHYGSWQDGVLKERKNVYANTWSYDSLGFLDRGLEAVGAAKSGPRRCPHRAAKFMMGSDGFLNPMSGGIGPVVFAPVSDDDKRLVLGLTVARLLDRVGALPPALKERYLREPGSP